MKDKPKGGMKQKSRHRDEREDKKLIDKMVKKGCRR